MKDVLKLNIPELLRSWTTSLTSFLGASRTPQEIRFGERKKVVRMKGSDATRLHTVAALDTVQVFKEQGNEWILETSVLTVRNKDLTELDRSEIIRRAEKERFAPNWEVAAAIKAHWAAGLTAKQISQKFEGRAGYSESQISRYTRAFGHVLNQHS